ncbi:hypothetical protein E3Q22_00930 [Wallemia mellicola]|uniref:Fumarylacetoacetase-like C-terminal domain-containing protein n=2 Tax=Wallemia mellicola TaxID=1708541 RepID=A0A4T0TXW6_9BASI|nr:hypothetical protein WALSEDRAFT_60687 [Wallemia mellicola CBS 633.66]TIB73983.1 hypothetical protein E3Q24_00873 [Wallemia mellicola]EIM21029.1 hypothetical protein WALSEDRAFT_60687 [Wallemia mellicola CBS 633.66]TIB78010.1 hypothetical protein E3Q23_00952 [Wallemia mellicola]TIB81649.1 hypothetical protein E3Q22_00930 [Wallemia mellicola]TIB93411.1 hypothetical protein E3Q19_01226 [Wallemia mellicola]|eukprot:XP_006959015.1 hypothetical protein WALSEDRAFT_60687 [Wallemia mellicola CBS 633.66]
MASRFHSTARKIVAIGRNYSEHAKELQNAIPKEPFFFLKPTSSFVRTGGNIEIPNGVIAHHEVELGVVIGQTGRDISQNDALSHIAGYSLGIDMTARNIQDVIKKKGLPWSTLKGFDTFTPIGDFIPKDKVVDPHQLGLWLKADETIRQMGTTSDMIFRIPRLIQHVSSIMRLEEGDVLLTGTPSGVGPLSPGQTVTAGLTQGKEELDRLELKVVQRQGGYVYQEE